LDQLHNERLGGIEILDIDLGRVQARPDAGDATTVCSGLSTAHRKIGVPAAAIALNFSRKGCVCRSLLERFSF